MYQLFQSAVPGVGGDLPLFHVTPSASQVNSCGDSKWANYLHLSLSIASLRKVWPGLILLLFCLWPYLGLGELALCSLHRATLPSFSFLSSFFFIASEHFSSPYSPIHSYTHYLAKWCWQSHTKAMKNLRHKVCPCSLHGVLKLNTYCTQYVLTAYLDFSAISPHR